MTDKDSDPIVSYTIDDDLFEYRLSEFPPSYVEYMTESFGSVEAAIEVMEESLDYPSACPTVHNLAPWHIDFFLISGEQQKTAKVPMVRKIGTMEDTFLMMIEGQVFWPMEHQNQRDFEKATWCNTNCEGDFAFRLVDRKLEFATEYSLEGVFFHEADAIEFDRVFG